MAELTCSTASTQRCREYQQSELVPKPYRISDFTPRNFEGSNDKGEFRNFMSNLHLWMQAWTDEGETMLVSVESTHKVDNCTLAIDCSDEEFGSIETSLYQVLRRTLANEPLRQKGFEP